MLILGMNTKRQRQPNVRLGEIGDVSASFSGKGFLRPQLDKQRWEVEPNKPEGWNNYESPRASMDTHSWEMWNPNLKEYDLGLEEIDRRNPRMGFGMVNRKRRLKKQRKWNMSGDGINSAWHPRVSPEISDKGEKAYGYGNSNGCLIDTDYGHFDHNSRNRDEDACERNSNGSLPENSWKQENNLLSYGKHYKKPKAARTIVSDVKEWLMELGFGKYAGLFEMHEVDMEALRLLTYEDLKEMGIDAVGTRRRIYSAIRLLSKGSDTTGCHTEK